MTGDFLTVPIMRPNHCWTVLQVSILAVLVITLHAESNDCSPGMNVRRDTVYSVNAGQDLTVNCTVQFCRNPSPQVSWYKFEGKSVLVSAGSHISMKWSNISDIEGISYLVFQKIHSNDSGVYQCGTVFAMSHKINVTVHGESDSEITTVAWKSDTTTATTTPHTSKNLFMYVYSAAGITAIVIVVIVISVLSIHGCKGKSKKETPAENQYVPIPMVEQHHQPLAGGSPSAPSSQHSVASFSGNKEHIYDSMAEDEQRQRTAAEDEDVSSVVYAALNHRPPPGAAARAWTPQEEFSEYAAIRVS